MSHWSFTAAPAGAAPDGQWYAVLSPRLSVFVPADDAGLAAHLWTIVDGDGGFDETVDALLSEGLAALRDFVVIERDGDDVTALVRGSATVTLTDDTESITVSGVGVRLWSERWRAGVSAISVVLSGHSADTPEQGTSQVESGLVRLLGASWGGVEVPAPAAPAAPQAETPATPPAAPPAAPESDPEPDGFLAPPPSWSQPEPDAAVEVADHDGHTVQGAEAASPPQSVLSEPVARLVVSNGEVIDVDRAILFGRAPEARRFNPTDRPRLVTVPSPMQEVSSTHLEIRPGTGVDLGTAVATDLGSTNGTLVMQPGLPPDELQPGIGVSLMPGAVIDLGDGVTIQVTQL